MSDDLEQCLAIMDRMGALRTLHGRNSEEASLLNEDLEVLDEQLTEEDREVLRANVWRAWPPAPAQIRLIRLAALREAAEVCRRGTRTGKPGTEWRLDCAEEIEALIAEEEDAEKEIP